MTAMVAVTESALPQASVTLTQKLAVAVRPAVKAIEAALPPTTGIEVSPLSPWYHWNESGAVPVAVTDNITISPFGAVRLCGSEVIAGGVHALATKTHAAPAQ
jgi:hypothetical protein